MAKRALTPSRLRRCWSHGDAEHRRELIINTALDLHHRRGPEAVTVRRVAERLGVGAMTLYTYVKGQDELRRQMTRRGFEMLSQYCQAASTLGSKRGWRGGAVSYVRFALENPNLYMLMFSLPYRQAAADKVILEGGFRNLLDKVAERFSASGMKGKKLERESRAAAGRFWVALHGVASLALAGRLSILHQTPEDILDDLLHRVEPDRGYD